jgi:hypothetical protein
MILGDYLMPLDMDIEAVAVGVIQSVEHARPHGAGYDAVTLRLTEPMHLLLMFAVPLLFNPIHVFGKVTLIITKHSHLAAVSHPSCQLQYSCTSSSPPSA